MSEINKSDAKVLTAVSCVLNHLCDGEILEKINKVIEKLINEREIKSLLEDRNVQRDIIKKFLDNFNALKLLLEIYENNCESVNSFSVEDILQSIRDIFDVAVEVPDFPDGFPFNLLLDIVELLFTIVAHKPNDNNVSKLANFYQYNLYLVKIKHEKESNENKSITKEMILRLQILSRIYDTVLKIMDSVKDNRNFGIFLESLSLQISEVDIAESIRDASLFAKIVTRNSDVVATQTLLCIIPKYIRYSKSNSLLQNIWDEISNYPEKSTDDSRSFLILCHLLHLYFDSSSIESNENLVISVLEDEKYWMLIQNGLMSEDASVRKQALFIFRKSIEELKKNNYTIACHKRDELNVCNFDKKLNDGVLKLKNGMKNFVISNNKIFLLHNDSKNIMWWDPRIGDELYTIYSSIFEVIECLEEKQAHIVKPIFEIIEEIIQRNMIPFKNGKNINVSWTIVIFQRVLSHDNTAIVKWGISKLLNLHADAFPNEEVITTVVRLLIKSLNKTNLYTSENEKLCKDLNIYFSSCGSSNLGKFFYKILIKQICSLVWSPEALYFVTNALTSANKCLVWEEEEILLLKKFVTSSIATHYSYIKSGIQCHLLRAIINFTDTTNIKLETVASVLGSFHEALQRGSKIWGEVVSWIEYCYSKRNAEEFILKFIVYDPRKILDEKCISKVIVLLHDAHLFGIMKCCGETPSCQIINALTGILSSFKDFDKRVYGDKNITDYNLSILSCILNENLNVKNLEETRLVEIMLSYFSDIVIYVEIQMRSISGLSNFHSSQLYIRMFENILKAQRLYRVDSIPCISSLFSQIVNDLKGDTDQQSPMKKYLGMKLLKFIMEYVYHDQLIPNIKLLQSYFKNHVNTPLSKTDDEAKCTKDLQVLWGKMNSEYLEAKWYILERLTNEVIFKVSNGSINIGKFISRDEIIATCMEAFEVGGYSILVPVMSVLKDVLTDCEDASLLKKMDRIWELILERRKSDEFWVLMQNFIETIFQRELIAKENQEIVSVLLEYSKKIFSEATNGLPHALLKQMQQLGIKYNLNPAFCHILASGLLYGPVQRKNERLIIQICSQIESLHSSPLINDWYTNSQVRAIAVQIVLSLDQASEDHQKFVISLVDNLIEISSEAGKNKSRYFGDSYVHRVKHRLLQSLLLLEPYLPQGNTENLYRWLCDNMMSENHQPSVRYQQEWLLVRILFKYSNLRKSFWIYFNDALEKRTGSLCSFISVAFHLCKILPDEEKSSWMDLSMQQFLPYCMAQHFSVRLYSQVTLQKLWELAKESNLNEIINKYEVVSNCLIRSIESGNAVKNCVKLQEDFYFTVFHPLEHYSIQTIYSDLPRLANVGSDEWISYDVFKSCGLGESLNKIPIKSKNDFLENYVSKWELRTGHDNIENIDELDAKGNSTSNFQKKMVPVKSTGLDYDELFDLPQDVAQRKQNIKNDGLIVVASLIDKTPNLGGLARTCEVFGVSEYVLGSLKYIEDKQFQSLSVTAEKWISITEVKPFYLKEYLVKMKQNGYAVLGAEQTSKSQVLADVKFPKKSLLLLGNEKEGIPPELLPLLDICIEIPQFGIVRSLNVHVTGALFIYEYAKQHLFLSQ